jgi:hypothetical protein
MKKIIILSIVCRLAFLSLNAQIELGVCGGADYTTMNIKLDYQNVLGIQGIPAYHFGIVSKYLIRENLYLTTDLSLAKKGFTHSNSQNISTISSFRDSLTDFKVSLYFIEIPILTEFKAKFEKMNVLFAVGPYISYGIVGKVSLEINSRSTDINYSENIRWSKYNYNINNIGESIVYNYGYSRIKRFDYGTTIRFGVEFNSIILNAEYKYGLANLMWEYRKYERMNTQNIGLSLIYLFNLMK